MDRVLATVLAVVLALGGLSVGVSGQEPSWRAFVDGDEYLSGLTREVVLWRELTDDARLVVVGVAVAGKSDGVPLGDLATALNEFVLPFAMNDSRARGEEVIDADMIVTAWVEACPIWPICRE